MLRHDDLRPMLQLFVSLCFQSLSHTNCQVTVHKAPLYMTDCCIHTSDVACCQHLPGGRYHLTTVPDGLLHPHLRHCSSPASAVRRLPSAVRAATPAFHVRSSGLFCSRPGGLELVTRLPARSVTRSFDSFRHDLKTFLVLHSALEALRLYST